MRILLAVVFALVGAYLGLRFVWSDRLGSTIGKMSEDFGAQMVAGMLVLPLICATGIILGATTGCALAYPNAPQAQAPIALACMIAGGISLFCLLTIALGSLVLLGQLWCYVGPFLWAIALLVYGFRSVRPSRV